MSNANSWIKSLLDNLESLDNETVVKVLEDCGRSCCRSSGYYKKALDSMSKAKDVNEFVDRLGKAWSHLHREGEKVYVVYDRCYCPLGRALLKDYPNQLSLYCNCSRGWVREMFESALKKPVKVELEKSIIRGDELCRFKVTL
jgi:predicted hydrocarbon binding protein